MELEFAQQSTAFLCSILLGAILGLLYGCFKFMRIAFHFSKWMTVVSDILFMLIAAVSVFFFALAFLSGYIRIYLIPGVLIGFLAVRCTIGKLVFKIYNPVIHFMHFTFHQISLKLKIFAKKLLKIIYRLLYNVNIKRKSLKNAKNDNKRTNGEYEGKTAKNQKSFGRFNRVRKGNTRA